jgi:tetratricopeptide (TPR) repeat protein
MKKSFWREEVIQPGLKSDVEAAIAEQRALLEGDPHNAPAYFALGALAHFQGSKEEAIALFQKAIECDPAYAPPHVSLGRLYALQGRYELAWEHAHKAERLGDRSLRELLERYPNCR